MEGADIYQVAQNCRTSVEMIEKHCAIHIKNKLDAAAINVVPRKAGKAKSKSGQGGKTGGCEKRADRAAGSGIWRRPSWASIRGGMCRPKGRPKSDPLGGSPISAPLGEVN